MITDAAVLRRKPGRWDVVWVELGLPREGEVLVEMVAAVLRHSDHHLSENDPAIAHLPLNGGHEDSAVVREL